MKILLVILIFLCYVPLSAQSSKQAEDTLWIEPFLESLKIVMNNAEAIDFILLEPRYADEVGDLPNGVYLTSSLSKIENYAAEGQDVYYLCLTSFKIDSWTAQMGWKNMSVCYDWKTHQMQYMSHIYFEFVYHYDGTSWSKGPSAIQHINHSYQDE